VETSTQQTQSTEPAYIIPQSYRLVKFLAEVSLEVVGENAGVLKVVGLGLQLVCVIILNPHLIACGVAGNFICPAVAVAFDGEFAVCGVELIGGHGLPFFG
jgi:hypothetical protein